MSKSEQRTLKQPGAAASRSKSTQKVLDIERRFIDDLISLRRTRILKSSVISVAKKEKFTKVGLTRFGRMLISSIRRYRARFCYDRAYLKLPHYPILPPDLRLALASLS